jgi:hypothetical protein
MAHPKYFYFEKEEEVTLIGPLPTFFWKHWSLLNIQGHKCFPLAHLYSLNMQKFYFRQSKCDKSVVILGTWGTPWESDGNILGTHWKLQNKNKKSLPLGPLPSQTQKEKTRSSWQHVKSRLIGLMKSIVVKLIITNFGLG